MFHRVVLIWMLAAGLSAMASAQVRDAEGVVDQVQLLDASAVAEAEASFLVLSLTDERHFVLPGTTQLAATEGLEVAIDYLEAEADDDGALPEACRVQVLAVPIQIEGEETMQRASRPFEIYRNPSDACQ